MARIQFMDVTCTSATFVAGHGLKLPATGDTWDVSASIGEGGFGEVLRVDGRGVAIKLHNDMGLKAVGGVKKLFGRFAALGRLLDAMISESWQDRLLALPWAFGRCQVDGRERVFSLMLDLGIRGYEDLQSSRGRGAPVRDRLAVAASLAATMDVLARVPFVHADLNVENVLVNWSRCDAQLIDFDAGAVFERGNERPSTPGKTGSAMPPEIKGTASSAPIDLRKFTPEAERWSLGIVIGEILFGATPCFFLKNVSAMVIDAYAQGKDDWPYVTDATLLWPAAKKNHEAFLPNVKKIPDSVRQGFVAFFRAGTDGSRRPTPADWQQFLQDADRPPEIESLTVSDDLVLVGDEIELSWSCVRADQVEIVGVGAVPPTGRRTVSVERSQSYELIASSLFGTVSMRTELVRAVAPPAIDIPVFRPVPVPRFGTFASTVSIPLPDLPMLDLAELSSFLSVFQDLMSETNPISFDRLDLFVDAERPALVAAPRWAFVEGSPRYGSSGP